MASIRKRKHRPRQDGTAKSSWLLDYRDPDGNRRKRLFATRAAAETARDDLLIQARDPMQFQAGPETFAEAADIYLKMCEKVGRNGRPPVEVETAINYRKTLEGHVLPKVGHKKIAEIRAPDVVAFRDWLVLESGKGAPTIKKAFVHYRGVLAMQIRHFPRSWQKCAINYF